MRFDPIASVQRDAELDQCPIFAYTGWTMFLMISKSPRKPSRTRSVRYRAKLKAKNRNRRNRLYCRV